MPVWFFFALELADFDSLLERFHCLLFHAHLEENERSILLLPFLSTKVLDQAQKCYFLIATVGKIKNLNKNAEH